MSQHKTAIYKKDYKMHISGLKGFACIMVMIGHYIGLYKYAENFPVKNRVLELFDEFLASKASFVLDETFWVILFFVVSGYLVAQSDILDFTQLIKKWVLRFLRLGIPVLFAGLVILLLSEIVGFSALKSKEIFECSFVQNPYKNGLSLGQVVASPFTVLFMGDYSVNEPYWVLREMFLTSLLAYLLSFLKSKIKKENIYVLLLVFIFFISMLVSRVVFAGIFGVIVALCEKDKKIINNKIFAFCIVAFCASLFVIPRKHISCIFFSALVVFIPKLPFLNSVFSSKFAAFMNKISFGIYSFHWPVFISFGMLILVKTYDSLGLFYASIAGAVSSIVISILISVVYYYLIEQHIYKFLRKIETYKKEQKTT